MHSRPTTSLQLRLNHFSAFAELVTCQNHPCDTDLPMGHHYDISFVRNVSLKTNGHGGNATTVNIRRRVRSLSPTSPPVGESDDVSLRDVHVNRCFSVNLAGNS